MPLSPRMPDLAALEVLLAIAQTGSLGAAGRELGMTQQAVSSRLSAVEGQTGVRLVTRTTRGSALTAAGVVVAEWAAQLLEVAERVDTGLASLRTETRSRARVAASLTIAEQLMPRWLVALQMAAQRAGTAAPEVTFTATDSDHVIAAVRSGDADVGFIEIPGDLSGVQSRVIGRDELIVVVAPEHDWTRRSMPITVAELNDTPLVSRESGWRHLLGGHNPVHPAGTPERTDASLELSSAAAVRAAVLAGAGPAVMSRLAVRDDLAQGRLHAIRVDGLDLRRELRAIWTGGRTPPAGAVRDLLAHITAEGRR